jgi:hypothetical protein
MAGEEAGQGKEREKAMVGSRQARRQGKIEGKAREEARQGRRQV